MHRPIHLLLALLCAAGMSSAADAGAWLRQPGRGFASATGTLRQGDPDARQEVSLYTEYGLTPRLTLGADINERPGISGHAMVFARLPLSRPGARNKFAIETALGGHHWRGDWDPMYRLTLSYGHGFVTRRGISGWLALDAAYERRLGFSDPIWKLDATLGRSAPGRIRPILQIETSFIRGQDPIWAIAPGLMIDTRRSAAWVVGLERKSAGRDTVGLKIALWHWF